MHEFLYSLPADINNYCTLYFQVILISRILSHVKAIESSFASIVLILSTINLFELIVLLFLLLLRNLVLILSMRLIIILMIMFQLVLFLNYLLKNLSGFLSRLNLCMVYELLLLIASI